jgi:hypothetical protein
VNSHTPQHYYCQYHRHKTLSSKTYAKLSDDQFQPKFDENDDNIYGQDGKFDPSDYRDGPSLFIGKFNYDNPEHTTKNIGCSNPRRMNHSYDDHAKEFFGMTKNRKKENLRIFRN